MSEMKLNDCSCLRPQIIFSSSTPVSDSSFFDMGFGDWIVFRIGCLLLALLAFPCITFRGVPFLIFSFSAWGRNPFPMHKRLDDGKRNRTGRGRRGLIKDKGVERTVVRGLCTL
jgi:hypothetical protein